jgi:argininosuccinate lyase
VLTTVHNTPFGDVVDTEDDLQPLVASTFRDARRAVLLVDAALRAAAFDVARLESRAAEGGTTLTELADHLVRQHRIPFRTAHAIAGRLLAAGRDRPGTPLGATLATVSGDLLGVPLQYSDRELEAITSARHFVEVRQTPGGPAPSETGRALEQSQAVLAADLSWLADTGDRLAGAHAHLRSRSAQL